MQYISPNPLYKFITREHGAVVKVENVENGFTFYVAKDSMGTQICYDGKFFPNSESFGTVYNALAFLGKDDNLQAAEKFFRESPKPDSAISLYNIMTGLFKNNEENLT